VDTHEEQQLKRMQQLKRTQLGSSKLKWTQSAEADAVGEQQLKWTQQGCKSV